MPIPQLVSLQDMLSQYAHAFAEMNGHLVMMETIFGGKPELPGTLSPVMVEQSQAILNNITKTCETLALTGAVHTLNRMRRAFNKDCKITAAAVQITALREQIEDALRDREFFYVQPSAIRYYKDPFVGWGNVPDKFPSAMFDIEEAGKCLALERHTACVMHLMRALEVGIRAQATALNALPPKGKDEWGHLLEHIEKAIRAIPTDPQKPADWRDSEEFHSRAATYFRAIKNAWRNAVMHGREKFGEEEARVIYDNVRSFMAHVAARLAE